MIAANLNLWITLSASDEMLNWNTPRAACLSSLPGDPLAEHVDILPEHNKSTDIDEKKCTHIYIQAVSSKRRGMIEHNNVCMLTFSRVIFIQLAIC